MSEYGEKDLAQLFKEFNDRLDGLEAQVKYPTESREAFMGACLKDKSMEECSELWQKVSREKGEQAYGKPTKPYGSITTIKAVKTILRRAGIKLSEEDENKLIAQMHALLAGKETREIFEGERLVPVFGARACKR